MRIWQVKMGDLTFPNVIVSKINVSASTLRKAVSKAESIEKGLCVEMNADLDTSEKIIPNKAIAVEFLCEVEE